MEESPTILALLERATADDLAAIDAAVERKSAEADESRRKFEGELSSLKALRDVISLKLNGPPPKPAKVSRRGRPPKSEATNADCNTLASKMVNLITVNGPLSEGQLAGKLGTSTESIRRSLGHCSLMFSRTNDGRVGLPTDR